MAKIINIALPEDLFTPTAASTVGAFCGLSAYKDVIIQWDEDFDPRVLGFIDSLPEDLLSSLVVVQERKGTLSLTWSDYVPPMFQEESMYSYECVDGDIWPTTSKCKKRYKNCIHSIRVVSGDERTDSFNDDYVENPADYEPGSDDEYEAGLRNNTGFWDDY